MASDRLEGLPPDGTPPNLPPEAAAGAQERDGLLGRLVNLVVAPGKAMEAVRAWPRWVLAGLLIALCVAAFTALTTHIASPEQMELMRDTRLMRLMDEEQFQEQYEKSLDPSPTSRISSGVFAGVGTFAVSFVFALVFLLFSRLAGGRGTFRQVLGVTFWSFAIPYGLGTLLRLPLVYAKQSVMGVSFSPAALMTGADPLSAPYQAAYYFGDLFMWWGLIVAVIGFKKIHGFGTGQASLAVILPWLIVTAAIFGLGRIFI